MATNTFTRPKLLTLDGGIKVATFTPPPREFNPITASALDLEQYGFPSMPTDPKQRARFEAFFTRMKSKLNVITPTFRVNADRQHGSRKRDPQAGAETSTNWSGAVVSAPQGQSFKWIQGDFVVPDVDAPTQNQWYYAASWIGIDGDGSGDVFQAGVETEVYRNGSNGLTKRVYPWFEWYPFAETEITNLTVSPGDLMTVLLCSTQGAGSTTGTAFISNRTTGTSVSVALTAPDGTSLVGNCAEWIVEAPTVGGAQSRIADFGQVVFTVAEAVTEQGTTVSGGTGDTINLVTSGTTESEGTLVAATTVEVEYLGSQP